MIFDKKLMFSDNQDFGDATPLIHRASSTIHDLSEGQEADMSTLIDPGQGNRLSLTVQVEEAFVADTGTPELQIELVLSPAANLLGGTDEVVLARIPGLKPALGFTNPEFLAAVLIAGARFSAPVAPLSQIAAGVSPAYALSTPTGNRPKLYKPDWHRRYLGVIYTVPTGATDDYSAGKLSAWLQVESGLPSVQGTQQVAYPSAMEVK